MQQWRVARDATFFGSKGSRAGSTWEVYVLEIFLKILLIIFSLGLIAVVLLQRGKSAGLSGAISGGAEHLFGKQKARGLDLFLQRLTVFLAVGFFILALVVAYFVKVG
jgi:preprotein translocase subunit SecG